MNRFDFDDSRSSRLNPFSNRVLRANYGGGDAGSIGAAAIFAASNIFSWTQSLLVPGIQAIANIKLMDKQKDQYESIVAAQRQLLGIAVQNYIAGIDSLLPLYEQAFPEVPEAAEYVPIDACCIQRATIECNIDTTGRSNEFVQAVNRFHEQNDIIRAIVLDPRFLVSADLASLSVQDLLRGRLPIGDVVEILTDNAEQAALYGRIGNTRKSTARDLGISKVRAQAAGRDEFHKNLASMAQSVSPLSRQVSIESMLQTPQQRIALALQQAQLIQNSLQNLNNRNAQKSPYLMAQLQTKLDRTVLKLQFEAQKGLLQNTFVPNYAAALQPAIRSITQAIGESIPPVNSTHFFGQPGQQEGTFSYPNGSIPKAIRVDQETGERI